MISLGGVWLYSEGGRFIQNLMFRRSRRVGLVVESSPNSEADNELDVEADRGYW